VWKSFEHFADNGGQGRRCLQESLALLLAGQFELILVNPQHIKVIPGRKNRR
jgi:hypothetical protein